ncbi:hypothetical protein MIMGU_mgv1a023149mg [Erythranthe guttata]|uniref:Glycosyltransferase 61 catalytic domain-containing protein n=1 Tax=Erythranthe guttata TaxID=4155 RepID=A0A022RJR3_ERYGU|nr:hypothetical protein MIMGU_mgv1a023149mg [Erythranthe guttata]
MYYDPIFEKSFSRYERKRFGCCAFFLCLIVAFAVTSTLKPHFRSVSMIVDPVNFQLSIKAAQNMLVLDDRSEDIILVIGDIRVEANSSTIYVLKNYYVETMLNNNNSINSWTIEPYPRKYTSRVKKWTIKLLGHNFIPKCTQNHTHPAILFSLGGFTGNYFHDFADLLFPLYSTSYRFRKEVHFLASDYEPWLTTKFRQILDKLTSNRILDIDKEISQVHCFKNIVVGLKFHKELVLHPSLSSNSPTGLPMSNFRQLIREAYSLERETAIISRNRRPRLMIVSRTRTRAITNENDVSRLAIELGYEAVLEDARVSTDVGSFAMKVNSFDVLMGVHGAGLTNMVFLPDNAVLIQVVSFGPVDRFARLDFGNPTAGMNLRYLEYKITAGESSLSQQYSNDHPIVNNPNSYKRWNDIWSIYLQKQNVTIDLLRLKGTLVKALKLLRH